MSVMADRAVMFKCEHCGCLNYHPYTLELKHEDGECLFVDIIDCRKCDHSNRVIDMVDDK